MQGLVRKVYLLTYLVKAVCGIINVDFTNKVIKLKQERMIADLECSFSFGKLKIKQGKILSVPTDYKVEYV